MRAQCKGSPLVQNVDLSASVRGFYLIIIAIRYPLADAKVNIARFRHSALNPCCGEHTTLNLVYRQGGFTKCTRLRPQHLRLLDKGGGGHRLVPKENASVSGGGFPAPSCAMLMQLPLPPLHCGSCWLPDIMVFNWWGAQSLYSVGTPEGAHRARCVR